MCRFTEIKNLLDTVRRLQSILGVDNSIPAEEGDINSDMAIIQLTEFLEETIDKLKLRGPTAQLWIQYFECVNIALQFIEAERLGRWKLHLQCVKAMLPIFHATGRVAYAKCAQIYLQDMPQLSSKMDPREYKKFADGYFTIRRSDKQFSGIWTDMTIEQTLNRLFSIDIESRRGITEGVVARFLQAMPSMYAVLESLEQFTGVAVSNSKQHKDINESRQKRDAEDTARFVYWLPEKEVFASNDELCSLSTGVVAGLTINCHQAFEIGSRSMSTLVGKTVDAVKISFANKVKPLGSIKATIKDCDDSNCPVDSTLLFQKICFLFHDNEDVTKEALRYELAPYPLSLFTSNGFMRKCAKSTLYKCFRATQSSLSGFTHVVDGGFLLLKVVWQHNSTFRDIFNQYVGYIRANYQPECVVVFDGYGKEDIDIKTYERFQRKEKFISADLKITPTTLLSISQSQFLANIGNKNEFVALLSRHLEFNGIRTKVAKGDADTLIINTAVELTTQNANVVVIGNDIDLLVLAVALIPPNRTLYFKKVVSDRQEIIYCTDDHKHLRPYILFLHAFSGCDTTSAIFRKGKNSLHKLLLDNPVFQDYAKRFYDKEASEEELYEAGEATVMLLYGSGTAITTLENLRYERFQKNVASASSQVKLASLPPTKSALMFHIKRVYYQIQLWLGRDLDPEIWGWKKTKTMYIPVAMNVEPAPSSLLSKISCGCKNNCSGSRCSCRKARVQCSALCKHCSGTICENSKINKINWNVALDDDLDELEEEVDDVGDTQTSDSEDTAEEMPEDEEEENEASDSSDVEQL